MVDCGVKADRVRSEIPANVEEADVGGVSCGIDVDIQFGVVGISGIEATIRE